MECFARVRNGYVRIRRVCIVRRRRTVRVERRQRRLAVVSETGTPRCLLVAVKPRRWICGGRHQVWDLVESLDGGVAVVEAGRRRVQVVAVVVVVVFVTAVVQRKRRGCYAVGVERADVIAVVDVVVVVRRSESVVEKEVGVRSLV